MLLGRWPRCSLHTPGAGRYRARIPKVVTVSVQALVAIAGIRACNLDDGLATAAGCRGIVRDMTDHLEPSYDDMPRAAGAGSPAHCKQLDPGDDGKA
jgi:hypothetical protein